MVVNAILGYLGSQIGSYFCKKTNKQATKQDGNQPIFQSSPPPLHHQHHHPQEHQHIHLHILPSCLALIVTKTLRLTEKLLLRSTEGSFLYCSLTVPQTA